MYLGGGAGKIRFFHTRAVFEAMGGSSQREGCFYRLVAPCVRGIRKNNFLYATRNSSMMRVILLLGPSR
jgi:hypothetical protein